MEKVFYGSNMYVYPYYANAPQYYGRNSKGELQHVLAAITNGLEREATAIDLYSRLVEQATTQQEKNELIRISENKQVHLKYFTDLFINLTGQQPSYQMDQITFQSYREGLQKAYELQQACCEAYRKNSLLSNDPFVQQVFLNILTTEQDHASRFGLFNKNASGHIQDHGGEPFVVDIEKVTKQNENYRTALWTGNNLQVTLMSIVVGGDIGLEVHPDVDQFLRIEDGQGLVQMGDRKDALTFERKVKADDAIMVPAGVWHNLTNTGNKPLKVYSIYAPPEHAYGTVHETKEQAMSAEDHHRE